MYSHDGKGSLSELCLAAEKQGLSGFAVTDHCDCECADDEIMLKNLQLSCRDAEKYKEKYNNRLTICKGVEIGEVLFNPTFAEKILSENNYDIVLGSVHAVRIKDYDMPFSLIDFSYMTDDFIERYVTQYFLDLLETAEKADYDVLCHLTVVLRYIVYKYNRSVNIERHFPVITAILKEVIRRDKTLEVNTSGITDGYFMPDKDIIKMYRSLGGKRITIGSDAHIPENISNGLDAAVEMLKDISFDSLTYYSGRNPVEYKI